MSAAIVTGPIVVAKSTAVVLSAVPSISYEAVSVVPPAVPTIVISASYEVDDADDPLSSYDTEADPLSATLATAAVEAIEVTANSAISFFILFSI
jgi:hypothetical protein